MPFAFLSRLIAANQAFEVYFKDKVLHLMLRHRSIDK